MSNPFPLNSWVPDLSLAGSKRIKRKYTDVSKSGSRYRVILKTDWDSFCMADKLTFREAKLFQKRITDVIETMINQTAAYSIAKKYGCKNNDFYRMTNPFASWTIGDAERHNSKVGERCNCCCGQGRICPSHGDTTPEQNPMVVGKAFVTDIGAIKSAIPQPLHDKLRLEVCSTTDEVKLNKTEKRYWELLKRENHLWVGAQCLSLKLGDDCRYNPDFIVITQDGKIEVHETKGFMRPGARVKLKTAARTFTWIKFIIVRLTKGVFEKEVVKA